MDRDGHDGTRNVCMCRGGGGGLHSIIEKEQPKNGQVAHSHLLPASLDLISLLVSEICWP